MKFWPKDLGQGFTAGDAIMVMNNPRCSMGKSYDPADDERPMKGPFSQVRSRKRLARGRALVHARYMREQWLARASDLTDGDRILVEKAIGEGMSSYQLADAFHVSPASVRRRLRRIKRVLNDPYFKLVAHYGECLPMSMRPMARSYFVEGLSLRQCATHHCVTLHQVRQMLALIRSMLIMKNAAPSIHASAIEQARAVQLSALNLHE